jgi:hypothetical protein
MEKLLWAVVSDVDASHKDVYSVWSTEEAAEQERHRLATTDQCGPNTSDFHVLGLVVDPPIRDKAN